MKEKVMNGLEKFSKAMLSPLSYISAAGLILVLGALLTSTSLSAMIPALQWTPIKLLGQLIYNCIMVIINIPVILILSRPALAALKDYTAQRKTGRNPVFKAASINLKEKTDYWN